MKTCLLLLLISAFQNSNSQNVIGTNLTDSFPTWVKNLYETDSNDFLNNAIPSIIFFKQLTDSTSYCLYNVDDGVCLMTFVATQKNRQHYKRYKIQNECDADLSLPEYSHTNYEHDLTKRIITSTTHVEKSKSKYFDKRRNWHAI